MGFSCLSIVGLCLFRIGDRAMRSLSTASDRIACKTKVRCGQSWGTIRLPPWSARTSRRAMGQSLPCACRQIQARCAAVRQSRSCFSLTASQPCAASKASTKHPQRFSGSNRSPRVFDWMRHGCVRPRLHVPPSYLRGRTRSRICDSICRQPTSLGSGS